MAGLEDKLSVLTERSVWENHAGSCVMTVTGLLDEGRYRIEKEREEDGAITLICTPVD